MSIKLNLKDLDQVASAQGTDKVLICYGADGVAKLLPISALVGSGGVANGASGILLTCEENGYTYQVSVRIVDSVPVFDLAKVSGEGQYTSILCADNDVVYRLSIVMVNGKPTLSPTAI